jgi:hypothetical protein
LTKKSFPPLTGSEIKNHVKDLSSWYEMYCKTYPNLQSTEKFCVILCSTIIDVCLEAGIIQKDINATVMPLKNVIEVLAKSIDEIVEAKMSELK